MKHYQYIFEIGDKVVCRFVSKTLSFVVYLSHSPSPPLPGFSHLIPKMFVQALILQKNIPTLANNRSSSLRWLTVRNH